MGVHFVAQTDFIADAPAMTNAVELKGVSAGYGDTVVLEDVNLGIAPGESISVIGRNGVGKTTLLIDHHGPHHPAQGRGAAFGPEPEPRAGLSPRRSRDRLRAAGARDFPLAQRAGESRRRRAARPLDQGKDVRAVSRT